MKIKKSQIYNILTLVVIALIIIPQTRKPIQVSVHKIFALFSPSIESEGNRAELSTYNWALLDKEGKAYNLTTAKDKVIFVNLWATWCPPCVAELPSMQKLYNDYGDKVTFLFVSNEKMDRVTAFLDKKEMNIPVFQPASAIPEELYSKSIPATYIIGKDGQIHVDKKGAANWNSSSVRSLLDKLINE